MVGKIWDNKFWWSEVGNCKKYSCCVGEVAMVEFRKNAKESLFLAPHVVSKKIAIFFDI